MAKKRKRRQLFLVRHADALDRDPWGAAESQRPLSDKGRRQAVLLAARFDPNACERVISSPALRCRTTVEPLAWRCGLEVESAAVLAEGSVPLEAFQWIIDEGTRLAERHTLVACTHGDVLEGVLGILASLGIAVGKKQRSIAKGATIALDVIGRDVSSAQIIPPPREPRTAELGIDRQA